jgi:hypothetical protein
MTESSAQDRSGQDRISAPLALHEVDAITNFTRDASQSANDQDQSLKVGLWDVFVIWTLPRPTHRQPSNVLPVNNSDAMSAVRPDRTLAARRKSVCR